MLPPNSLIFMGKVTFNKIMFDKTHSNTVTKKSSKPFVKLLEHPHKCLDLFTYAGSSVSPRVQHCGDPALQSEMAPRKKGKNRSIWPFHFP